MHGSVGSRNGGGVVVVVTGGGGGGGVVVGVGCGRVGRLLFYPGARHPGVVRVGHETRRHHLRRRRRLGRRLRL